MVSCKVHRFVTGHELLEYTAVFLERYSNISVYL
jgi:hypothetical protein